MRKIAAILIFIIIIGSNSSYAFKVDGFRSNMTTEEASKVANKINANSRTFTSIQGVTHISVNGRDGKGDTIKWKLLFCNNKLVEMEKHHKFRWRKIVDIVSRLNKDYGEGVVSTLSENMGDLSTFELSGTVSVLGMNIFWKSDTEAASVSLKLLKILDKNDEEIQRKKTKEKISEYYGLFNVDCLL